MKNAILLTLLASVLSMPALAALKEGESAPEFKAQASLAGKTLNYSLKEALKNGPVVVYFFPSAYTSGCNIQAHAFAVNSDKFDAAGASIIGVSLDSIERLNKFSADPDYCAGKFPIASDGAGKIAKAFELQVKEARRGIKDTRGADIDHGFAERTTFIVTPDGKVASTLDSLAPEINVQKALEFVQNLSAQSGKIASPR